MPDQRVAGPRSRLIARLAGFLLALVLWALWLATFGFSPPAYEPPVDVDWRLDYTHRICR